jgi:hypothetical protein
MQSPESAAAVRITCTVYSRRLLTADVTRASDWLSDRVLTPDNSEVEAGLVLRKLLALVGKEKWRLGLEVFLLRCERRPPRRPRRWPTRTPRRAPRRPPPRS